MTQLRAWVWVLLGLFIGLAVCGLVTAQTPGPTPAQLEERARATDRTLTIVRERELDMTRLVALYANRLDEVQKELAQVRVQLEAMPACPARSLAPPTPEEGKP